MSDIGTKAARVAMRYDDLNRLLSDPEIISDPTRVREYAQEQADLEELYQAYQRYEQLETEHRNTQQMLAEEIDEDLVELAQAEIDSLDAEMAELEARLTILLLPKDPNDDKNVIVEIRAGAGGDEAGLFASDLYRMYTRYADTQGWKYDVMTSNPSGIGGYKEIIFEVRGRGAYSRLKFESGVHRVQRVPATESQGRIHTSTATVIVMPEQEDVDVQIDPNDVRIDIFQRTRGAIGQHHRLGRAVDPPPHRSGGQYARRKIAVAEQNQGDDGATRATVRFGATKAQRRIGRDP